MCQTLPSSAARQSSSEAATTLNKTLSSAPESVNDHRSKASSSSSHRRRNVRFGASVTQYYDSTPTKQLQSDLWWSIEESDFIMSKALGTAAEVKKHFILTEALDQAVKFAGRMACVLDDQKDLNGYLESMNDEGRGLKLWCQYGHSRRGIEKYTSRIYHDARRRDTRNVVKQVVTLSRRGASPELIRQTSESLSRPYAVLARMFGVADAKAATSISPGSENNKLIAQKLDLKTSKYSTVVSLQKKNVLKRSIEGDSRMLRS
jgi:hypothetical protein